MASPFLIPVHQGLFGPYSGESDTNPMISPYSNIMQNFRERSIQVEPLHIHQATLHFLLYWKNHMEILSIHPYTPRNSRTYLTSTLISHQPQAPAKRIEGNISFRSICPPPTSIIPSNWSFHGSCCSGPYAKQCIQNHTNHTYLKTYIQPLILLPLLWLYTVQPSAQAPKSTL